MELTSCAACQELVEANVCRCPHCDAAIRACGTRRPVAVGLLALSLWGCAVEPMYGIAVTNDDDDRDGFFSSDDCDDTDPLVNPAADEVADNGVDDDCDGEIDESTA